MLYLVILKCLWGLARFQCQRMVDCHPSHWHCHPGSTTCELCQAGKASSAVGATLPSTCIGCPKGTYSAEGSQSCMPCLGGTYSETGGRATPRSESALQGLHLHPWLQATWQYVLCALPASTHSRAAQHARPAWLEHTQRRRKPLFVAS